MVNCSPNGSVLSHLLLITVGFFSSSFSFLFSFSFSDLLLLCFSSSSSSFFLYSSINFFLPPLTSLPLKNLLHPKHLASRREPIQLRKLLTEGLDLWPVGLSPSKPMKHGCVSRLGCGCGCGTRQFLKKVGAGAAGLGN